MKKPYVAIVDDDASFAQYLRTFLSLRGYEARCYTRGDELLASMKQSEPPDVVLLDVMMPGLDGMATLRALKASRPEAQVIMLSGRNQASTIVEAVRLGAADYVVKPDDPEGLGEIALDVAIKSAIEKNRLVADQARRASKGGTGYGAAWGDPAIVLRCGTGPGQGFTDTSQCQVTNGVGWYIPDSQIQGRAVDVTMTTVGRAQNVQVSIPKDYFP